MCPQTLIACGEPEMGCGGGNLLNMPRFREGWAGTQGSWVVLGTDLLEKKPISMGKSLSLLHASVSWW